MVTIKDVAKEAKVAPSTVSRVIANNPRISEKTKKRVKEVMEKLGYYPNLQARSLAAKSTQTIGVIMPNFAFQSFQSPLFPEVLRGISMSAHTSKYGINLSTGSTEDEIFEEVVSMVMGRRVDGIILLYSRINDKVMSYLEETGFPFTMVGRPWKNEFTITHVDNDHVLTLKKVTEYLIKHGHKHIAFIGGDLDTTVTVDRLTGYRRALTEAGYVVNDDYFVNYVRNAAKQSICSLLALDTPPTALVVENDLIAFEMISHLESLNINIPEDISIVSVTNIFLSEHSKPPLTSVDIGTFKLGQEATQCLIEKIENPVTLPKRITIPTTLIERKSVTNRSD